MLRSSLLILPVLLFTLLLTSCIRTAEEKAFRAYLSEEGNHFDLWIRHGTVIDGSGAKGRQADILVRGDEIRYIGWVDSSLIDPAQIIDATDKIVTPGFIDTHAHGDPFASPRFRNFLTMGVTTICLGQDGSSPERTDLRGWMTRVDSLQPGVNIALFAGHGTLRLLSQTGYDSIPTPPQQQRLEALLRDAMAAGCFGLSTGLEYTPGLYAREDELIALAKVVGEADGLLTSHVRNEDNDAIAGSLRELLRQGQYCRVQASHLKVVFGKGRQRAQEILALLDSARNANPYAVTADVYPYTASFTGIGIVFPTWAKAPNNYEEAKKLHRDDLLEFLRDKVNSRNGPEATLFGTAPYAGKTLAQVAAEQNKPFEEVLLDIGPTGASAAYFVMDEELQTALLADPHVMVCSDGSPTMRHPRGYGSFPKIIQTYVLQERLFSLEEAIRKMTSLPAATLQLTDRGLLAPGMKADILVFDPQAIAVQASYTDPNLLAKGMSYIVLNGKLALEAGEPGGRRYGRMLRKTSVN